MRVREHLGSGRRGDLVSASRRNDLFVMCNFGAVRYTQQSSRSRGRARQHASRVRSPDNRSLLAFRSLIERNEIEAARAQFFFSANQRTQRQTPDARLNGNPWSVLFGRRSAVSRRFVRTSRGVRRFAEVCWGLFYP